MSAISSATTSSPDLFQLLQNQNATTSAADTAALLAGSTSSSDTPTSPAAASGHHHHHHGISKKIESAVTDALKAAPDGSDPNQVITDAITQALGGQPTSQTNGSAPSDPTAQTPSADTAAGSNGAFTQLLQSYGINAKQFKQDLQTAVGNLQNNSTDGTSSGIDFAALFKSLPPGSAFQATA